MKLRVHMLVRDSGVHLWHMSCPPRLSCPRTKGGPLPHRWMSFLTQGRQTKMPNPCTEDTWVLLLSSSNEAQNMLPWTRGHEDHMAKPQGHKGLQSSLLALCPNEYNEINQHDRNKQQWSNNLEFRSHYKDTLLLMYHKGTVLINPTITLFLMHVHIIGFGG